MLRRSSLPRYRRIPVIDFSQISLDIDIDYSQDMQMDTLMTNARFGTRTEMSRGREQTRSERERRDFQTWLLRHCRQAAVTPMPALLKRYGGGITVSSAYRLALKAGLRGRRRNRTRYTAFWMFVNWELPDSVLERVWKVARGNLRQRRLRLGVGPPVFRTRYDHADRRFLTAVAREEQRARDYTGPRPH